jgi:hypothetical protein
MYQRKYCDAERKLSGDLDGFTRIEPFVQILKDAFRKAVYSYICIYMYVCIYIYMCVCVCV